MCTSVGGRLAQFVRNWRYLTTDPWVLETVQGYHLPLNLLASTQHGTMRTVKRELVASFIGGGKKVSRKRSSGTSQR